MVGETASLFNYGRDTLLSHDLDANMKVQSSLTVLERLKAGFEVPTPFARSFEKDWASGGLPGAVGVQAVDRSGVQGSHFASAQDGPRQFRSRHAGRAIL